MVGTMGERLEIRERVQAGRLDAAHSLQFWLRSGQSEFEGRTAFEQHIAANLTTSEGLVHAYFQGMWYEVSTRPLSIVRQEIGRSLVK